MSFNNPKHAACRALNYGSEAGTTSGRPVPGVDGIQSSSFVDLTGDDDANKGIGTRDNNHANTEDDRAANAAEAADGRSELAAPPEELKRKATHDPEPAATKRAKPSPPDATAIQSRALDRVAWLEATLVVERRR